MNVVLADFGSYSLKVARFRVEKTGLIPIDYWEELSPGPVPKSTPPSSPAPEGEVIPIEVKAPAQFEEHHLEVLAQYLKKNAPKDKSVFIFSERYLSSRILHLPVKSIKKAELMIPHQLEESIPFPIENIHLLCKYTKSNSGMDILAEFTTSNDMNAIYQQLKSFDILPNLLTSSSMLVDEFVKWFLAQTQETETVNTRCWSLVDIGHTTTKIYTYEKDNLRSKHSIGFGGKMLDLGIARAYKISVAEAQNYKHKNAFYLTSLQVPNASKDEAVFAEVMGEETLPLVQEMRRYFVSLKVKYGLTVEFCYFTGGGQRIPNFVSFMGEKLDLPTSELPLADCFNVKAKKMEGGQIHSFGPVILGALAHVQGKTIPNLLRGNYSTSHQEILPLTGTVFLTARTAIFALIVLLGLLVEKIFLYTDEKQINAQVNSILKSKVLNLTTKEERTYRNRLDRLTTMLQTREKSITQEVSTLSAASRVNAVKSLAELSQVLQGNQKVDVVLFENLDGLAKAVLKSADKNELKKISDYLENTSLKVIEKKIIADGPALNISFDGQ
ncbi:MAG: pilus assembly protein PilM [Bdellovibrio sp.]|nr:pilus assembly protein PilM [Bdellovibrio sp.]